MGVIIFNGKQSSDYGIVVENPPSYVFPKRRVESITVPGRNGNIIIDEGAYDNVTREYNIAAGHFWEERFTEIAQSISHWLNSAGGNYARLEDSYEPEIFRMATYTEETEIVNILQQAGRATVSFDCKPQRFLKSGENFITFDSPSTGSTFKIRNSTQCIAEPLIVLHSAANTRVTCSIVINGLTIAVGDEGETSPLSDNIVIDSEVQDAYSLETYVNLNKCVTLARFPTLVPGDNTIEYTSGNLTKMEVKPRWWIL